MSELSLDELARITPRSKTTATRKYIVPGDGDRRHGTANGYMHLACRCGLCRRAYSDYYKRTRKLKLVRW